MAQPVVLGLLADAQYGAVVGLGHGDPVIALVERIFDVAHDLGGRG